MDLLTVFAGVTTGEAAQLLNFFGVSVPVAAPGYAATTTVPRDPLAPLLRHDPNFSRPVFEDFCYSLYAHLHLARATGDLARYAPYASGAARGSMAMRSAKDLTEVRGIVIGAMNVAQVRGLEGPIVTIVVEYEANLTEVVGGREASFYLKERWFLDRRRDVLSPPPAKAKAEHCPRCGAPLRTRTDGSCESCGVKVSDGSFQWYVRSIVVLTKDARGPLLTSDVPEVGTELPTRNFGFPNQWKQFTTAHQRFQWEAFEQRVRATATELQKAWTERDWERVRPLETEQLFQTHRYWIDAYIRQQLRNVVEDHAVTRVEPAKISSDAFYDAFTVRLFASGRDYTVKDQGEKVAGSRVDTRIWSEYWTFLRTRGTEAEPSTTVSCPNCGASVVVGSTGVCRFCSGKLTSGEFGWVLSRIEQDEAYAA